MSFATSSRTWAPAVARLPNTTQWGGPTFLVGLRAISPTWRTVSMALRHTEVRRDALFRLVHEFAAAGQCVDARSSRTSRLGHQRANGRAAVVNLRPLRNRVY